MIQIRKTILNDQITTLLETIQEQFETVKTFEGKIPMLEFEILKDNIRQLYENLYLLQRMNDPFELIKQKEQEIPETPPANPSKKDEEEELESVPTFVPPVQIIEEVIEPPETESEPFMPDIFSSGTPVQIIEVVNEAPESEAEAVKTDISSSMPPVQLIKEVDKLAETKGEPVKVDLFTSETNTFNKKLMEAREQSLGPRFRQSTPADIKSLININDKFSFINELFDGDYKEYTHTIEIFNNFDERGEAFEFLDSLLKNNLWNSTSPAFLKLKEIVEKRFT